MNPLIITAFTIGGAIAGYFLCALMTAGKVEEITYDHLCQNQTWQFLLDQANAAHSRASDALTTCQNRLHAIRALANAPRTIRKADLWAILNGER